jgi:hypothetical protein
MDVKIHPKYSPPSYFCDASPDPIFMYSIQIHPVPSFSHVILVGGWYAYPNLKNDGQLVSWDDEIPQYVESHGKS